MARNAASTQVSKTARPGAPSCILSKFREARGDLGHPPMREEYFKKWHEEHDPKPGKEPMPESVSYRGVSFDDVKPHLGNFFEAVRTRKPVVEDVVFGHHAALACHMANESYFRKAPVSWDEGSKSIKG